jgi:hypothetical protein
VWSRPRFRLLLAIALLLAALLHGEVIGVLDGVGPRHYQLAIIETAKSIATRNPAPRSNPVIAASLEARVMVFETVRTDATKSICSALLFAAAMFALIALGVFQWLWSRIAPPPSNAGESIGHGEPADEASPPSAPSEPRP